MNFIEAIKQVRKGREVRRKGWFNKHCTLSKENFLSGETVIGLGSHYSRIKAPYMVDFSDVFADDWEVYK